MTRAARPVRSCISSMHSRSNRPRTGKKPKPRNKRRPAKRGVRAKAGGPESEPADRRSGASQNAILAHVFEVMKLFPNEGDLALAELVGRIKAGRTGAKKRRRGK